MFLLVPAHPGCPGQIPQSRKTVVCVCSLQASIHVKESSVRMHIVWCMLIMCDVMPDIEISVSPMGTATYWSLCKTVLQETFIVAFVLFFYMCGWF